MKVAIAANKMRGTGAAQAHDTYTAHQTVEHDIVNVCCLGARAVGANLAGVMVSGFVPARFTGKGHRMRRLNKITAIEKERT